MSMIFSTSRFLWSPYIPCLSKTTSCLQEGQRNRPPDATVVPPLVGKYGLEACSCQARREELSNVTGSLSETSFHSLLPQTTTTSTLSLPWDNPSGPISKWSQDTGPALINSWLQWTIFNMQCFPIQCFHNQKFQPETPALMSWVAIHL